jgi:Carboxypeptidase regulatory-like domain
MEVIMEMARLPRRRLQSVVASLVVAFSLATSVSAQNVTSATILGKVTDETGALLPGVTVTVSGPALQVPQLVTVTDASGSYRILDLPVGVYRATYELSGFATVVREGLRLSVGFAARVDAQLKVGTLQETVTVSGQSPVVDVASTAASTNFSKDLLESIPKGRGLFDVIPLASGVTIRGAPDAGDTNLANKSDIGSYGVFIQPTILIEGVNIQTGDQYYGSLYFDYFSFEDVQIKAAGNDAEVSVPGIGMIAVVKAGGNDFHGTYAAAFESGGMQGDNLTDALRAQGLSSGNQLDRYYDAAGDLGGRLLRDKVWFYGELSRQYLRTQLAGFVSGPGPDGVYLTGDETPAKYESSLDNAVIKGSFQLSKDQKMTAVYMRGQKHQPQITASRLVPLEATTDYRDPFKLWKVGHQASPSPSILVESLVGYGGYFADYRAQSIATGPRRTETTTGISTGPAVSARQGPRNRYQASSSVSYFPSGTFLKARHQIKVGVSLTWENAGSGFNNAPGGNYALSFTNGVAKQITTYNYPVMPDNHMNTQALFVKDTISFGRVTLNVGARYDRYHAYFPDQTKEPGQFGDAGTFQGRNILTWNRVLPRLGIAWDVTGSGKTLVKANAGWYGYSMGDDFAQAFNPNATTTTTYRWTDPNRNGDYDPGEVDLSLSGKDFINVVGASSYINDPELRQPLTTEVTGAVQRELMKNTAFTVTYVYKQVKDLYNKLISSGSTIGGGTNILRPYSLYTVVVPRQDPGPDGKVGTADDGPMLNLSDYPPAYRGSAYVGYMYQNAGARTDKYHSVEFTFNRRMTSRWSAMASFWVTKNYRWIQATPLTPNDDLYPLDETWSWEGRLVGSVVLPWNVAASATLRSQSGVPGQRTSVFSLPQSGNTTVRLSPFGQVESGPAVSVLNLRASKRLSVWKLRFDLNLDVFNALNTVAPTPSGSSGTTAISYLSGPTYGLVTSVMSPRVVRVGLGVSF